MGACSSKPKTTETEDSMEPHKPADNAADEPKQTERSLDNLADSHEKDALANSREEGQASTASTEPVQLPNALSSSTEEGTSEQPQRQPPPSDVIGEKEPVYKPVSDEVYQKERNGDGVSDETLKEDVGGGGTADDACESEAKGVKLTDGAKACKDKAVVSEESGGKQEDGVYVDKTVALDEAISPRTPGERNIVVPAGGKAMDSTESTDVESPIIGVVKHVESTGDAVDVDGGKKMDDAIDVDGGKKMDDAIFIYGNQKMDDAIDVDGGKKMDDAIDIYGSKKMYDAIDIDAGTMNSVANPVKDSVLDGATTDIRAVAENPVKGPVNAEVGVDKPDHVEDYAGQGEIPLPASSVEPVCSSAEADHFHDNQSETASQLPGAKMGVDVSPLTVDSNGKAAEFSTDTKLDHSCEERETNHYDHSHGNKPRSEVGVDNLKVGPSMASENASSDGCDGSKDPFEEVNDGEIEPVVRIGQMQGLSKEIDGYGTATGSGVERELNWEKENGQISASKPDVEKQTSERPCLVHTPSGDLGFEDLADRLDPSKSMESTPLAI